MIGVSFKLVDKIESMFGDWDDSVTCMWKYEPIKTERDGWEVVIKAIEAIGEVGKISWVRVLGPYYGEKEMSDIGEKSFGNVDKMRESIEQMIKDENYQTEVTCVIEQEHMVLTMSVLEVNSCVDFSATGSVKQIDKIDDALKKL